MTRWIYWDEVAAEVFPDGSGQRVAYCGPLSSPESVANAKAIVADHNEAEMLRAKVAAAQKFVRTIRHLIDALPAGYMERIALEIFEEAMRSVELVHRVGESGFVEDWTALDQRPLPVHAKIVRTITVKRPEGNFDEGSVFRVQGQSEGVETETYWRATKVEPMGDGEIEVTAELVAAPSAPTG